MEKKSPGERNLALKTSISMIDFVVIPDTRASSFCPLKEKEKFHVLGILCYIVLMCHKNLLGKVFPAIFISNLFSGAACGNRNV